MQTGLVSRYLFTNLAFLVTEVRDEKLVSYNALRCYETESNTANVPKPF